ncbi:NusG domain II-containing protein [Desulfitobacterium sp. THU1]|uniref:NusG domain II-containing protein n=1 Tax=Desulfitobacterium sp. THU1 TaxID=3138072 RepID=UPI00311FD9C8
MKSEGKRKKGDFIIILVVLLVGIGATLPWLWNKVNPSKPADERIAVITRGGKEMARVDLSDVQESQRFHYEDGIEVTILAEDGTIKFEQAGCPDQICVKTGTLTKKGDIAVCLPSETIVVIEGDKYE